MRLRRDAICAMIFLALATSALAEITCPPYMYLDTDNPKTAIHIAWRGGQGTVHYGIDQYSKTSTGKNGVHLTGLKSGARYKWYLEVDGHKSELGSFQLDPGVGGPFKAALFGDTQDHKPHILKPYFEYTYSHKPDLLIILGDLLYTDQKGGDGFPDSRQWYDIPHLVKMHPKLFATAILVPVMGNHDAHLLYWQSFFSHLPQTVYKDDPKITPQHQIARNYMIDYGNVTFAVNFGCYPMKFIDVGETFQWQPDQLAKWWAQKLDQRIKDKSLRPMVVVLSHKSYEADRKYAPVFQSRNAVAWYNGHTHHYMRTKWLKRTDKEVLVSDTQADEHMIYCHAGQPFSPWPGHNKDLLGYRPIEWNAAHNCKEDPEPLMPISVVSFTGDGKIIHKAYKALNSKGQDDGDHRVIDHFTIDATSKVTRQTSKRGRQRPVRN